MTEAPTPAPNTPPEDGAPKPGNALAANSHTALAVPPQTALAPAKPAAPPPAPPPADKDFLSARRPMVIGLLGLLVLVGGFGSWSVFSSIAGAIVTPGMLEVEKNRQVVQHPDGGVVDQIAVKDGDSVAEGDLLIQLDGAVLQSELAIVEGQYFELVARRARLEAERDGAATVKVPAELQALADKNPEVAELLTGQLRLFTARSETLSKQTQQLGKRQEQTRSQIDGIDAQKSALESQLALINEELGNQQALLAKGLAEASRVLALQREQARLQGQVGELTASRAEADGKITEIELEVLRLAAARREEANTQLRDLGAKERELAERRRALIEQIGRLEIRAPVSGVVLGMQVTTPRSVIRPADPVLYIIPQDRPLVIMAQVTPIHVDEVHVGQETEVMFPAFSARTTPHLKGHVTMVSADALTDQSSRQTYYRAEITLDPGEMDKLHELKLVPGMPVEAFIKTDERSPLAYFLKPFTDYFVKAFRET